MNTILVSSPMKLSDDFTFAIISKSSIFENSALLSLPDLAGETETVCRYEFPEIGTIDLPGLNCGMFDLKEKPCYNAEGHDFGLKIIRLPAMYTLCERALKKTQSADPDYNWQRFAAGMRRDTAYLTSKLLVNEALRKRRGLGWMALSQANPRLPENIIQVSTQLANEILPILNEKHPGLFQTINDLNGLEMSIVIRFPTTTSKGIRIDMRLIVGGPGRAFYLNPFVLKYGFVADVDGDLFFGAIRAALRKHPLNPQYNYQLPRRITRENFNPDICLTDVQSVPQTPPIEVYYGMTAKEGIGPITNACYRSTEIAIACFQFTPNKRRWFLDKAGRPDLEKDLPMVGDEETQQRIFRQLVARIVVDEFEAFYESVFDMRKDRKLADYINHFLEALRRPDETKMNFDYLCTMIYNELPIRLKALPLIWDECKGRLSEFINEYPIVALQFLGKGVTQKRQDHVSRLLDHLQVDDVAQIFEDELTGCTRTIFELEKKKNYV